MDSVSLDLLKSVADNQKNFIVIFYNEDIVLTNRAFNNFFKVSSTEDFNSSAGLFIDNFVPHPYYFHKEKIASNESWFDAVLKLKESDRIVSMMASNYDPHAFSIEIDSNIPEYKIVIFTDITQSLIKRIMIENNANMDLRSGAYAKKYFLQISRSYQDAALFNEKIIATVLITLTQKGTVALDKFVTNFKNSIRKDDMLIDWGNNSFLLVYLTESKENTQKMFQKLENIVKKEPIKEYKCIIKSTVQKDKEGIKSLIKRIF